jgi:DNA-binding transcriptional regulator YiaG
LRNFEKKLIEDILEDISAYGASAPCVVYFNRENGKIRDYLIKTAAEAEAKEEGLFFDEIRKKMSLFECLCIFIEAALNTAGKKSYRRANALIALRLITGLTQSEFGKKIGSPLRTIQNWENSQRLPPINALMLAAVKADVPFEFIAKYLNE